MFKEQKLRPPILRGIEYVEKGNEIGGKKVRDSVILEALKSFLEEKVTSQIKFKKANDENIMDNEFVNPTVYVGWIHPNGRLPKEVGASVPCIIVGNDRGENDGKDETLNIRLTFVIYNPGTLQDTNTLVPGFDGYKDLLDLIEKTKYELTKYKIIEEKTTVKYPLKWGMYFEQPYPYWHGWITFKVQMQTEKISSDEIKKYL